MNAVINEDWDLLLEINGLLWFQSCAMKENHNCGFDCALCREPVKIKYGSGYKYKIALCNNVELYFDAIEDRRKFSKYHSLCYDELKYGTTFKDNHYVTYE